MPRRLKSRATAPKSDVQLRAYPTPAPPPVPPAVMTNEVFAPTLNARVENRRRFGRSVSLDVLESALRSAYRGSMRDLTDILRETVETDPHLGSILNKRFGAVSSLPWEVQPATGPGIDRDKALFYAEVVRAQLRNMKSFRSNLNQLAWALFDGRACLEMQWVELQRTFTMDGFAAPFMAVREMSWIHPRRLSFGPEREIRINPEGISVSGTFAPSGLDVRTMPDKFVWWLPQLFCEYAEREGLGIRCMYWSFFKRFAARERMMLTELFGKPWRIITVDEESTAGAEDLDDADRIVDALGGSYTARLPRGTKLDVVSPGDNAGQVHGDVIKESDQQNSKLVLGQTGTTDGVPAGLNSNQANVMQDEQLGVLIRDAHCLSEVCEGVTDRIIAVNYGEMEVTHAPTFRLRADLPADRLAELKRLDGTLKAGLPVSRQEAYEVSGFSVPDDNDVVIKVIQPPTAPNSPVAPAVRPEVVYPEGTAPDAGEITPNVATSGDAPDSAAGAADAASTVTVNEDRQARGLDPLMLPDGGPDPRGELTIKEFNSQIESASKTEPEPVDPALAEPDEAISIGLSSVALSSQHIAHELAEGETYYGDAGIHIHRVNRGLEMTEGDGAHAHLFQLPSGEIVMTEIAGGHAHTFVGVDADVTRADGEHRHLIDLGGVVVGTALDGAHVHALQVDATAVDGVHQHTLEIPDPDRPGETAIVQSLTAGEIVDAYRRAALPPAVMAALRGALEKPAPAAKPVAEPTVAALTARGVPHHVAIELVSALPAAIGNVELEIGQATITGPNGDPEDYVARGMRELTSQTTSWVTHFENAVDGEITALGIYNALNKARASLSVDMFGRAMERRKLQSLMLGVLDSATEIADDEGDGDSVEDIDTGDEDARQNSEALDAVLSATSVALADSGTFTKMPFKKALTFFRGLNVLERPSFERATAAIKRRSFTVAGVVGDQMLRTIQAELTRTMMDGVDLRKFKKRLRARMQTSGFIPQKTGRNVPLSAPHIETVYRTNVLNTYNTGRYVHQTSPAVKAAFPVWELRGVNDTHTRHTHLNAHGKMLLASDPFWQSAYPPFGFNCRCRVIVRSAKYLNQVVPGSTIQGLPDPGFTSGRPSLATG